MSISECQVGVVIGELHAIGHRASGRWEVTWGVVVSMCVCVLYVPYRTCVPLCFVQVDVAGGLDHQNSKGSTALFLAASTGKVFMCKEPLCRIEVVIDNRCGQ